MTTPTNDRQTSERERLAEWLDGIAAVTNMVDDRNAMDEAAAQLRADEAEIAQLRTVIEQARRSSDYWKAEHLAGNNIIDALRAENEALRTALCKVRAHTGHTKDVPDQLHMELLTRIAKIVDEAFQSFIRSKEIHCG